MKLLGFAYLAVLLGVSSATEQMQINYYSDSGCSDYIGQVDVTWASYEYGSGSNCYNYNYGNSVNIANCYETSCVCIFYEETDCNQGNSVVSNGNCVTDAYEYYSFECGYK